MEKSLESLVDRDIRRCLYEKVKHEPPVTGNACLTGTGSTRTSRYGRLNSRDAARRNAGPSTGSISSISIY